MGIDIHMYVVKNKQVLLSDMYDGRNYDWFENLTGRGYSPVYRFFPYEYGMSEQVPDDFKERYDKETYYDFMHINVKNFLDWYVRYRPDITAGWLRTYDHWLLTKKGIPPLEDNIIVYPSKQDKKEKDLIFCEFEDPIDNSQMIYDQITKNSIPGDADLTYWFDC